MFGDFFGGKSPIKVRIYDFALYFDAKQVRVVAAADVASTSMRRHAALSQQRLCFESGSSGNQCLNSITLLSMLGFR